MGEIQIHKAASLDREEWRKLQVVQREGFKAVLSDTNRTTEEIDLLVGWDDPERYYASHADPNTEVGRGLIPNQEYTKPRVAVATHAGVAVGFAYSAHNVSGATIHERTAKRLSVVKNYLWLREVAVSPAYQRQGLATELGKKLLHSR